MSDFNPNHEYQEHVIYGPVSLCTPAVRMVAICAWACELEGGELAADHSFHPIVALRSLVTKRYHKRRFEKLDYFRVYGTHREMIKAGWVYEGESAGVTGVVCEEGYLECAYEALIDDFCTCKIFACYWPEAEDLLRLGDEIDSLHKEAIEKAKQMRAKAT